MPRRLLAPALTTVVAALTLGGVLAAPSAAPSPGRVAAAAAVTSQRVAGPDRYATAAAAARATHPSGATTAVLARGDDFPDALAAAPLVARLHAALLLTATDSLPAATAQALTALHVTKVLVLGDEHAVSAAVVDQLRTSYDVQRVAGADRYATAAQLAERVAALGPIHTEGGVPTAFVVTGSKFPDAVVAGAPATVGTPVPILLVQQGHLPAATAQAIHALGIGRAYVLGDTASVGPTAVEELRGAGVTSITRLAGPDRSATAVAVAQHFAAALHGPQVALARSDLFPDALVAGPYAGAAQAPVLLPARHDTLGDAVIGFLLHRAGSVRTVTAFGTTAAVPDSVLRAAVSAAGGTPPFGYCSRQAFDRMSEAQRVGQLFMVGVPAVGSPGSAAVAALRTYHAGAVVLTGRSSRGVNATRSVVDSLQGMASAAGVPLTVATDQEGGQVQVLSGPGFSTIPSALQQGSTAPATLQHDATVWGGQLAAAGVNTDLAPVMDTVPAGQANAPIGRYDREFGHTPDVVASHGSAFAKGMLAAGVAPTVKHFPGLGRASGNTDTTAGVTDTVTTRHDPYLAPYAAGTAAGSPFVMVSTATYTRIDPHHLAAFSPTVIEGMLRGDLGFQGVVVSDDLGAAASVQAVPVGQRAVDFIGAGGDLVLTVVPSQVPAMTQAVLAKVSASAGFGGLVNAAAMRVLEQKERAGLVHCG